MRKSIPTILISTFLLIWLALLASKPTIAQSPPADPKGPDQISESSSTEPDDSPAALQIDRTLLPKIEPPLLKKLLESEGQSAPFIVYLKTKADLSTVSAPPAGLGTQGQPDMVNQRTAIISTLQQTARDTQSGVLQLLTNPSSEPGLSGQTTPIQGIKPLWIVNAVAAEGNLNTILALAARNDVEVVRLDKKFKISAIPNDFSSAATKNGSSPNFVTPEWGISKIRADLVHNALNIDGTGIVVANLDTGVDWLHPALQTNYRGYTGPGKLPLHLGNWFDATGEGAVYPVDADGHGTHTMGTIAGTNGIGVAPGAKWIAVRTFNSSGTAQVSWLHNAFQWLLAPNGDPTLAPHIVNNSWSSNNGFDTEFAADVQALLSAGIYPVFAAGNNGPGTGSVGSPGSLSSIIAIGATDINDEIAGFSGRGPSPWGEIKPEVSAPGKDVRSSLPGGAYDSLSGTSMAAPHAAGLAALLLQASPTLANNIDDVSNVLISTAIPLGAPIPNNDYGWGRIDAYNAVMSVASAGVIQGNVTEGGGWPIENAIIQMVPRDSSPTVNTNTDSSGAYLQGLAANTYDVTASAFGYASVTIFGINIVTNSTTTQDFTLATQPSGTLIGTIRDKDNQALGLAATITVDGTPVSTTSDANNGGSYSLTLPVGVYTLTVVAPNYRIAKATGITINEGATVTQNFLLDSAPSILLVDGGRWYQESQISYYQQALTDLLYPADTWQITRPFDNPPDIPSVEILANYDIVIWSAPQDGPAYIDADDELTAYLDGGGRLLLSGQDIGYFDGGGFFGPASYYSQYLKAKYVSDNSQTSTINGIAGEPFAGLSLSLVGGDGADNQISPDVITVSDHDFAAPLLFYDNVANLGGLHIGLCLPYRALYLSFGFEGISSRSGRSQVMERALDWLQQQPSPTGVELTPGNETLIRNFGASASHTIRVRNTGTGPDIYNLSVSNGAPHNWPISNYPSSVSLNSCQTQEITVDVQLPAAQTWHISDTFTLTAQSSSNPASSDTVTRTTKTPAPLLLVDDDRFFSFADQLKSAVEANNIPYDYWLVSESWLGPVPPSPPLETLQMYPMTVWYTGYDWFIPLTPTEEDRLSSYLDAGGRLFFSSQDFLYKHLLDHNGTYAPFARNYLGVESHTEDYGSISIVGQSGSPVGAHLGPYDLTFPLGYKNWTDALTPTATAQIATLGHNGEVNGLTNAGAGSGGEQWHTTFLSYGPELLSSADRARLMQRAVGWLSWLGSSTVTPGVSASSDTNVITYTATIANNGWSDISTAYFTATFPSQLIPGIASPGLTPAGDGFVWSGPIAKNQSKVFTYTAAIAGPLPIGTVVSQTSWLAYPDHHILFDRVADVRVNFPKLSNSTMTVSPAQNIIEDDILAYTIVLKNDGLVDDPMVTTTNTLPHMLDLVAIDPPSQGTIISNGKSFTWTTPLAKDATATLTFRAVVNYRAGVFIENRAFVNDDINQPLILKARAAYKVIPLHFPIIVKNSP